MSRIEEESPGSLRVILHADDLGLNSGVTDGILEGFRRGVLTSTSVLSNAPDASRALQIWRPLLDELAAGAIPSQASRRRLDDPAKPFDLGVHLNLTQGRPLTGGAYPQELLDDEGHFPGIFTLFKRLCSYDKPPFSARLQAKVREELARQIEFVLDHGLKPTHLNGHQYIELLMTVAASLPLLLARYDIRVVRVAEEPFLLRTTLLRGAMPQTWILGQFKRFYAKRYHRVVDMLGLKHPDRFHGTAHAGCVDLKLMQKFLKLASPPIASLEIGLHPGMESSCTIQDDGWRDPLSAYRPLELQLLTSIELVENLERRGVRLGRLSQLA
jgi:predicted glycoside hydrolase/deacetylase ChbG (UPF0249 family)